jgi:enterochelin esterase family protein
MGKSSGGYGALALSMRHPDVFGAVASHSGDVYFEYCYRGDVPKFCTQVQEAGGPEKWLAAFDAKLQKKARRHDGAQHPRDGGGLLAQSRFRRSGSICRATSTAARFREDVWRRWLEHDPLRMVERHAERCARAARLPRLRHPRRVPPAARRPDLHAPALRARHRATSTRNSPTGT